ncbi:hypothetical protein EAG_09529 [Camponotus floridanus]|uniref:Uncharacterized protein n=1 Tax=Camponotus floridanus TaxID=104421 RepID=E1ZZ96_CAMFO|nr:hypothetical protein EAG_09529 [Camponotus floridanus]
MNSLVADNTVVIRISSRGSSPRIRKRHCVSQSCRGRLGDDEGSEPEVHRPPPHHARRSFSVRSPPSAEELIKAGTQLETA